MQNYRDIKPDTHSRLRGKEIPSLEEGRKAFAALAYDEIPRATKVHKAWTVMLIERGIIDKGEGHEILKTLSRINDKAIAEMIQSYDPHFYKWRVQFERYLMDKVGSIAGNINIGRTLPPPLYRMKLREAVVPLIQATLEFRQNLLDRADEYRDAVMPGYTHNQHAQPMTFGHYLLGLYEAIDRAAVQLEQAYDVINICDLGCGALAGTSFNVDREKPARFLGFDRVMEHTNDCVASTDQATNVVAAMINLAIPMSRVANEMHWWATFEFNMIELTDAICEASSMMPQKKSPCVFEEIRCTLGKVLGCYSDIVCRAQNTLYGDTIEVYEASEYVPNTVADVIKAINTFNKVLNNLIVKKDIMLRHAQRGFSTATELAAFLFRETHLPLRSCPCHCRRVRPRGVGKRRHSHRHQHGRGGPGGGEDHRKASEPRSQRPGTGSRRHAFRRGAQVPGRRGAEGSPQNGHTAKTEPPEGPGSSRQTMRGSQSSRPEPGRGRKEVDRRIRRKQGQ